MSPANSQRPNLLDDPVQGLEERSTTASSLSRLREIVGRLLILATEMLITSSTYIFKDKRYESPTTKSPELIFSAVLSDDGTRNVRFERAYST
jgi:hypothetical protein